MKSIQSSASLALFAVSFLAACGSAASLVGGQCREGMELRGDTCVDPAVVSITPNDPPTIITTGASEAVGTNTTPLRPGPPDTTPSDSGADGPPDAAVADDAGADAPPPDDAGADALPPDAAPPPPDAAPPPLVCVAPLVACRDVCISVDSDAANCGACGKICPSNICIGGVCQGATPGDVVLIGHDYTNALSGSAQTKVLVNALSIPTTDPIRVLSYEDGASTAAVTSTKALAAAGIYGRSVRFTVARSAADLGSSSLARSYDIVLIHGASAGDPVATGASWVSSLGTFTVKGGVVVALDNGSSPIPELLSSSGLLAVTSHTVMADGTHLAVTDAADVVGAQVLSPYASFAPSISFQGVTAPNVDFDWVVRATSGGGVVLGDPVVIHRIVRAP